MIHSPMTVHRHHEAPGCIRFILVGETGIVGTVGTGDGGEIDEANAARLAHCWNTHDGFKAIAEGVLTCLSYPRGSEAQVRCLEEVGQDVRALLAKEPKL